MGAVVVSGIAAIYQVVGAQVLVRACVLLLSARLLLGGGVVSFASGLLVGGGVVSFTSGLLVVLLPFRGDTYHWALPHAIAEPQPAP